MESSTNYLFTWSTLIWFHWWNSSLPSADSITWPTRPAFWPWVRQVQIIFPALILSLSEPILAYMINEITSRGLWVRPEKLFATQSLAHVLNTRRELATLKKWDKTLVKYIEDVQKFGWQTRSSWPSNLYNWDDHVSLSGLRRDYDSLVLSITIHSPPLSLDGVLQNLMTFRASMNNRLESLDLGNLTANIVAWQNALRHKNWSWYNGQQYSNKNNNKKGSQRRGASRTNSSIICQFRDKPTHSAKHW